MRRIPQQLRTFWKRWIVVGLAFTALLSTCALPLAVQAQVPLPVAVVGGVNPAAPVATGPSIENTAIEKPWQVAFMQMAFNVLTFVTQRVAYDAAVSIATAGSGQTPLINPQQPGAYATSLLQDTAGEALGALSGALADINVKFNVCAPEASLPKLALQLGIASKFTSQPKPLCSFQSIQDNWQGFLSQSLQQGTQNADEFVLTQFARAINPQSTDLTVGISITDQTFQAANLNKSTGLAADLAKGGYKDVTDVITGQVKTPSDVIQNNFNDAIKNASPGETSQQLFQATMQNADLWKYFGLSALSVFTNTLLSQLTQRLYTGLLPSLTTSQSTDAFGLTSLTYGGGVQQAQDYFNSLLAVHPITLDTYNAVSDFVVCPGTTSRQLDNCTMDTSFATAVGSSVGSPYTVQQAIDAGLLHGSWPVIGPTDPRNIDQYCYTYGYCYGNLVRLRLARIIDDGWELAAKLQGSSNPDTLQTIVDGFDNSSSPYYHLIDPNWVLKYPSTECRASVPGQLVSDDGTNRGTECVDAPSCIQTDSSGNCVGGYGYCVREKNTWDFRGESCPEQYATCLSFTGSDGSSTGDWLLNTVDYATCSSSNSGCLWYATQKTESGSGSSATFDWPTITDVKAADTASDAYNNRIYLTGSATTCSSSDAGCRELVKQSSSVTLNTIINPSFETDSDADKTPDNWTITGATAEDASGDHAEVGSVGVDVGSGGTAGAIEQTDIPVQTSSFYTLSFYAAQSDTTSRTITTDVTLASEDGSSAVDLTGTSYDTTNCKLVGKDTIEMTSTPTSTSFERFHCTFTTPTFTSSTLHARIQSITFSADGVYLDGVQLENGETVSDYREGYGNTVSNLSPVDDLLPPDYLGCTGSSSDPADCANYATLCSAQDVGCDLYKPTDGDPSVPGITSSTDSCPSTCNGYDSYKQSATLYEPTDFPVYFIPSSAKTCSAQYVGCDEFTNLGDESVADFTYLRACLNTTQASTNSATYYTWEGSDLTGYQLKSWTLLKSNLASGTVVNYTEASGVDDNHAGLAPCTSWSTTMNGISCHDVPPTIAADDSCNEHSDIFSNPDCREFYDTSGNIHYRSFDATVTVSDSCVGYRKSTIAGDDAATRQTNCTDANGFWNAATGECRFYGLASESDSCPAVDNGCREYTGGAGENSSIVYSDTVEGTDLSAYTDSNATIDQSNESLATGGHSIDVKTTADGGYVATASTTLSGDLVAGKTYLLTFWAKATTNDVTVTPEFIDQAGTGSTDAFSSVTLTTNWQQFIVGPLDTSSDASFDDTAELAFTANSGVEFFIDTLSLRQTEENIDVIKDSWVTPAECDETDDGASEPQAQLGCKAYTNSSGTTDYLKSFTRLCSESKVGCAAYYDTQTSDSPYGEVYDLKCETTSGKDATSNTTCAVGGVTECTITSGTNFCLYNVEGGAPRDSSEKLIQPDDASLEIVLGPETHVVQPDQLKYFVPSGSTSCTASAAGCTEVGKPTFNNDESEVSSWTSDYFIDDPDSYSTTLCSHDALFCQGWSTTNNGTYYFKNPNNRTCEYRSGVTIGSTTYSGWFRTGTDSFCYGTGTCVASGAACSTDSDCVTSTDATDTCDLSSGTYLSGGTASGIWHNGDSAYNDLVGSCSSTYNLCTEFTDPSDVGASGAYGTDAGTNYFYLNDDQLDDSKLPPAQQCNNQVSQKQGCALFDDALNPELTYNASATYIVSAHANLFFANTTSFDLVDPVSCSDGVGETTELDGTKVDLCTSRCAYDNATLHPYTSSSTPFTYTTACLSDNDCSDVKGDGGDNVQGHCEQGTFSYDSNDDGVVDSSDSTTTVTALADDTNEIKKTNPDRACAEWYSPATQTPVYDTAKQSSRLVTSAIGLCDKYTALGNTSFCAHFLTATPTVLTQDEYTSRNTSWYGYDYSGYSIPNELPATTLSQVNVNPGKWCVNSSDNSVYDGTSYGYSTPYVDCTSDSTICSTKISATLATCASATTDYRLAYNAGSCSATNGANCTIGFCSGSGTSCGSDSDCTSGESCDVGFCARTPKSTYTAAYKTCTIDSDCTGDTYDTCVDGVCSKITNNGCSADSDCTSGAKVKGTCFQAAATQTGTCFNSSCLLDPTDTDGNGKAQPYSISTGETQTCRAWPETNSPFPNSVVSSWVNAISPTSSPVATPGDDSINWRAYTLAPTFDKVNLCQPGQSCDCSYDKVTYGPTTAKYYDESSTAEASDLCVGGTYDAATCDASKTDDATSDTSSIISAFTCSKGGGTCSAITKIQTLIGMQGYCLQRDDILHVNGALSDTACLAWLPVDQLNGASDIYGKFTEAGYPLTDTYYCGDVSTVAVIGSSAATTDLSHVACAELPDWGDCKDPSTYASASAYFADNACSSNVFCPQGYYALLGRCVYGPKDTASAGTFAGSCKQGTFNDNDCPYVCVPENSVDTVASGTTDCSAPAKYDVKTTNASGTTIYEVLDTSTFDDEAQALGNGTCGLIGVDLAADQAAGWFNDLTANGEIVGGNGYRGLSIPFTSYPACTSVVQAASSTAGVGNFAWTDRLWQNNPDPFSINSSSTALQYLWTTAQTPFGVTPSPTSADHPFEPASCQSTADSSIVLPQSPSACSADYTDFSVNTDFSLSDPEARSYVHFSMGGSGAKAECKTDADCYALTGYSCSDDAADGGCYTKCTSDADCGSGETCATGASSSTSYCSASNGTSKASCTGASEDWLAQCSGGSMAGTACDKSTDGDAFCNSGVYCQQCSGSACSRYFASSNGTCSGMSSSSSAPTTVLTPDTFPENYIARIDQIFAAMPTSSIYKWTDAIPAGGGLSYDQSSSLGGLDAWDAREKGDSEKLSDSTPTVPVIRSIGSTCVDQYCTEGTDNSFSVNGEDSSNVSGSGGNLLADLRFYVEANANQLPIRRMVVDWQDALSGEVADQTGSTTDDNYYKNHRGLNPATDKTICNDSTATDFGETTAACDPTYVDFQHVYTCDDALISVLPACPSSGNLSGPCTDGKVCEYQPRVDVRDNWGWCTGSSCTDGPDGTTSCFDGDGSLDESLSTSTQFDECNLSLPNSAAGFTDDPWVYYDGVIKIQP